MRPFLAIALVGLLVLPLTVLTTEAPEAQQAQDTLQPRRDAAMNAVLAQIAGKEDLPAGEVFTNVTLLGDMPAGRMLRVMNQGYSRNIGVSCDYCHNTDDYGSDEKPEKQTARAMIELAASVTSQLQAIPTIKSEMPFVNCGTCHRGVARPGARPGE